MSTSDSQPPIAPEERTALGETDNDPIVLLELIQRLKVRDVMTSNLVTVPRDATCSRRRS